jgi:hypothetical protein
MSVGFIRVVKESFHFIFLVAGLENRDYGCKDPSHWPCGTFYMQKLALTSPTSGVHSV